MRALAITGVIVLSFASPHAAFAEPKKDGAFFCGGETTKAEVASYFDDLESALARTGPQGRFNRFVADRFGVRDADRTMRWFDMDDLSAVTPDRITLDEWQHIQDRGPGKLEDAGWKGCFMDHGKVWFEASEHSGLKLRVVARDMDWVETDSD